MSKKSGRFPTDDSQSQEPERPQHPADALADGIGKDGRVPSSLMKSYALLTPDLKNLYMGFYKATYGKSLLDLKTKEFVAIAASLALGCKGCLEGHLKKAKKHGATAAEISEVIAVTLGVAAATIVDRSDIANFNLGGLFEFEGENLPSSHRPPKNDSPRD
jgi:AhpD family alkylhydroperoxidase